MWKAFVFVLEKQWVVKVIGSRNLVIITLVIFPEIGSPIHKAIFEKINEQNLGDLF